MGDDNIKSADLEEIDFKYGQIEDWSPGDEVFHHRDVLETIFSFLPFEEILKMRSINLFCKGMADQEIINKNCSVTFAKLFTHFNQCMRDYSWFGIEDFAHTVNETEIPFPFQNYVMVAPTCIIQSEEVVKIDVKLCEKIAQSAKHITFIKPPGNWFWSAGSYYPYLTSLEIKINGDPVVYIRTRIFCTLRRIMNNSPCIESVDLCLEGSQDPATLTDYLQCFKYQKERTIQHLQIVGTFSNEHWDILKEAELKLKTLKIVLSNKTHFDSFAFSKFLERQSETLEELDIECPELEKEMSVSFPKMNRLLSLRIHPHFEYSRLTFPGLCYGTKFPQLNKLFVVGDYMRRLQWYMNWGMKVSLSVQYLELPAYANVYQAIFLLPKVKDLRCYSIDIKSVEILREINNVEKMTLLGHKYSEYALDYVLGGRIGNSRVAEDETFCEKLKYLKFVGIKITDSAAKFIIKKTKSLECLDIWECDQARITRDCLAELRKKLTVLVHPYCIIS